MALYGYARVSSSDQDFALQEQALRAAGCEIVRAEKASGTSRAGRTELATLLDFLRRGDTLVVTRIDRLARSIKDLQDIVHTLKERGVTLKATEQPIDTRSAAGKAFLDMLGVFAEFGTSGVSASSRELPQPKRAVLIMDASRRSIPPRSNACAPKRS
jgi:DNA invertase Pin-like site-specific DNA recombinase